MKEAKLFTANRFSTLKDTRVLRYHNGNSYVPAASQVPVREAQKVALLLLLPDRPDVTSCEFTVRSLPSPRHMKDAIHDHEVMCSGLVTTTKTDMGDSVVMNMLTTLAEPFLSLKATIGSPEW